MSRTPLFILLGMDNHLLEERPVAVYKTTISIILYELLYFGVIALFGFVIFKIDVLWAQILLGVCIVITLAGCVMMLRHTKDRIVITSKQLSLTNVYSKTKQGKWSSTPEAIIPWNRIKDISSEFNIYIYNRINIHKEVLVTIHNDTQYSIDSDLYDVFFLERKLRTFWKEYKRK